VATPDDLSAERKDATSHTASRNWAAHRALDFSDEGDFELARRGRIAEPRPRRVTGRFGQSVWDLDDYAFEEDPASRDDAPLTVNPSLWRQARLNNIAGLFEVTPRVFQVRGLDISNVTFVAGETGWVVIDPLTGTETAAAALALVGEHLGTRPVRAVIYTHSHTDHFGGIKGVVSESDVASGAVEVIAPAGFLEAAVSENVLAGTVMLRRATYMYGALLPRDPRGHVDTGLGKGLPALPNAGLVAPTREIDATGTEVVIDGVRLVFQITPGTEAPAEMNIFLPEMRALCMAENCTANLHNLYTPRGAQVRDALRWSKYINESIALFEGGYDVVFASHHWPRFGAEPATSFLESQRDAYRYVHDQTLRLANHGETMDEIAEGLELPAGLGDEFFNRDYYGTVSHNSKAVYQRYLGWFDGNPAHLHRHPPAEAARRYVEYMGGADAVIERARTSFASGDYRWVAEVLSHVVFADPGNEDARLLEADALEQLGYAAESGPWRDFYLTGAQELRAGGTALAGITGNALAADIVRAMTVEMLVDLLGVRLNGPRAAGLDVRIDVAVTDEGLTHALRVRRGTVSLREGRGHDVPDVTIRASRLALASLVAANRTLSDLEGAGEVEVSGDRGALEALIGALDNFSFGFEVVLP
jgi:alkyl sulfatase BDS1-like metallo-beta-lactamase superfamily hydrolase